MLKDTRNIVILVLTTVIIVLAVLVFTKKTVTNTETIYIPEEVIVEHVIQTETIAVPEEQLEDLVRDALGEEFEQVLRHIRDLNMEIVALSRVTASGQGSQISENVIEDNPEGLTLTPVDEELTVDFGEPEDSVTVPVAHVSLSEEGDLDARAYDIDLTLTNIVTETEARSFSAISSLTLSVEGEEYEIPITGQTQYRLWEEPTPEAVNRFRLLDPHLDLSLDASVHSNLRLYPGASLGLSLSSYSRGDQDLWRFIRAGIGFSSVSDIYFTITPATYNIGNNIPLFEDLWLGPSLGTTVEGDWLLGITLGTTL